MHGRDRNQRHQALPTFANPMNFYEISPSLHSPTTPSLIRPGCAIDQHSRALLNPDKSYGTSIVYCAVLFKHKKDNSSFHIVTTAYAGHYLLVTEGNFLAETVVVYRVQHYEVNRLLTPRADSFLLIT
jgi:hypothetical protein